MQNNADDLEMEIETKILEFKISLTESEHGAISKFIAILKNDSFSSIAFRKHYFEEMNLFRKKYYTNNYLDLLTASDTEISKIEKSISLYKTPQFRDEIDLVRDILKGERMLALFTNNLKYTEASNIVESGLNQHSVGLGSKEYT